MKLTRPLKDKDISIEDFEIIKSPDGDVCICFQNTAILTPTGFFIFHENFCSLTRPPFEGSLHFQNILESDLDALRNADNIYLYRVGDLDQPAQELIIKNPK